MEEKVDVHIEKAGKEEYDLGKQAAKALDYFDQHVTYTEEESRKVLRKIDFRLMPILAITYGLQFVDKVTLSYSANYGLIEYTHLKGTEYNWLNSAFYFSFLFFEFPSISLMQKFPVAKYLGVNMVIWGGMVMVHAACSNFTGLLISRIMLGVFESSIQPGCNMLTGRFYTKKELPFRVSCWVSFNGFGQFAGALLAYGIGHIKGSLPSWKYIFLLLGAITSLWGVVIFFFLDSTPTEAKFLNERERQIAVARVAENFAGVSVENKIQMNQVYDALTDPQVYFIFLLSFTMMAPNGGITSFMTLIIKGMGFDPLNAVLHQLPVGAVQFVLMLAGGYTVGKWKNGRIYVSILWELVCVACAALLWKLPRDNKPGLLCAVYFISAFVIVMITLFALLNTNVAGTTKKTVAHIAYFIGYCVGNISGPFLFKPEQAPTYDDGSLMMLICFSANIILLFLLRFYYMYENKRKIRECEKLGTPIEMFKEEGEKLGFLDKTDRENRYFLYSL